MGDARSEGVDVSREAIATLAAQAAEEVPGVVACCLKPVESLTSRVRREFIHKGVKVDREDGDLRLSLFLKVEYGVNLGALAREVAEKVKGYVEGLTELKVLGVEVVIEDVSLPWD